MTKHSFYVHIQLDTDDDDAAQLCGEVLEEEFDRFQAEIDEVTEVTVTHVRHDS